MPASFLLVSLFPVLLIAAAIFDLTSYKIPNILSGALLALFLIFLLAMALSGHAMGWSGILDHLAAGGLGLIAGMVLFAFRLVGGGDAKFFAVASLWLGLNSMLDYAVVSSLAGGALTFGLLTLRSCPLPSFLAKLPWVLRLAEPKGAVPYGVALAAGALIVLPGTELFRLTVAG
jgi:prepilin peptidase CpaA